MSKSFFLEATKMIEPKLYEYSLDDAFKNCHFFMLNKKSMMSASAGHCFDNWTLWENE